MNQRLSRFGVGQTAKVLGLLYGLMGLVIMPFFLLSGALSNDERGFGVGFALAVPVIYGAVGFIFTAIGCVLYNWVASKVGGIEISLDTEAART